jgi:enoyl-CoA hydratase
MAYENLRLELADGIATLTVSREKQLNALNEATLRELLHALETLTVPSAVAAGVRALIVTGAGEKAFVAGADIAELSGLSATESLALSGLGHRVMDRLEALPVPTIAAVNGFALGGGCELALSCDLVYASEKARFGLPEVGLGVIPGFGGTQRLSRLLGRQRAKEIIFTGEMVDAARAKEIGLVLDVVPPSDLLEHCRAVARKIAAKAPLAITEAKRAIEWGANTDLGTANALERQAFALLFGTDDQEEGMKAFLEKRTPKFLGR